MGGVYRDYKVHDHVARGFSIITRDPHARLSKYHDKATPLFLPTDKNFVDRWLNPDIDIGEFDEILSKPKIRNDFCVTPVQSVKKLKPLGPAEMLPQD